MTTILDEIYEPTAEEIKVADELKKHKEHADTTELLDNGGFLICIDCVKNLAKLVK